MLPNLFCFIVSAVQSYASDTTTAVEHGKTKGSRNRQSNKETKVSSVCWMLKKLSAQAISYQIWADGRTLLKTLLTTQYLWADNFTMLTSNKDLLS